MNNTQHIENYLQGQLLPAEHLIMETNVLINAEVRQNVHWQKNTYTLIQHYGRLQLKKEIAQVEKILFSERRFEKFRQTIYFIFKK